MAIIPESAQIMTGARVEKCIRRLAHQIIEDAAGRSPVHIVALAPSGKPLAEALVKEIESSDDSECHVSLIQKQSPADIIKISLSNYVVVVDDVMFTGRTMFRLLQHMKVAPDQIVRSLVLVDRGHRNVPLHADFVGFMCPTKLDEHVEVVYSEEDGTFSVLLQYEQ